MIIEKKCDKIKLRFMLTWMIYFYEWKEHGKAENEKWEEVEERCVTYTSNFCHLLVS